MPSTLASFPLRQPIHFVPFPQFRSHPNPNQCLLYHDLGRGPAYPVPDKLSVRCDVCGPQSTATVAHQTGIPALGGTCFQMALCHCPWCVTAIARTRSSVTSTNSGCVVSLGCNVGHMLLKRWCTVSGCLV